MSNNEITEITEEIDEALRAYETSVRHLAIANEAIATLPVPRCQPERNNWNSKLNAAASALDAIDFAVYTIRTRSAELAAIG